MTVSSATPTPIRRAGRPKGVENREQFLDAALYLFGEQGLASTTISHIAKRVGVTSAMVHYYFASREQLLDAIVAERIQPFTEEIWAAITPESLSNPKAVLFEIAQRILNGIPQRPWVPSLWLSDVGSAAGELRERVHQLLPLDKIEALTIALIEAQARGEINAKLEPHLIFSTIAGMILLPLTAISTCAQLHKGADISIATVTRNVHAMLEHALRP